MSNTSKSLPKSTPKHQYNTKTSTGSLPRRNRNNASDPEVSFNQTYLPNTSTPASNNNSKNKSKNRYKNKRNNKQQNNSVIQPENESALNESNVPNQPNNHVNT